MKRVTLLTTMLLVCVMLSDPGVLPAQTKATKREKSTAGQSSMTVDSTKVTTKTTVRKRQTVQKKDQANTRENEAVKDEDLIDLNAATEETLKTLPGIGDMYAKAIVDGRPYKTKNDLVRRKIIPRATYNKISNRIVARQR
jgi:DNA uptake protein ComE-like DNA-binding protein